LTIDYLSFIEKNFLYVSLGITFDV
jgi:hypothetical protein